VPIIVFVFTVFLKENRYGISVNAFVTITALTVFILFYAYLMYLLFEKNTTYLRNLITRKLKKVL
jgi:peptidoglycan/LPS O-acetylase OafA/YrhL